MRIKPAFSVVVALTVLALHAAPVDAVVIGDRNRKRGPDSNWDRRHPGTSVDYCADAQPALTKDQKVARIAWVHSTYPLQRFRSADVGYATWKGLRGSVATHELHSQWCSIKGGPLEGKQDKYSTFWMPLVTADAIIYNRDLLAEVETRLEPAQIEWLNIDQDHQWLWVRVEHFARIQPVPEIYVEDTAGDEITGVAHAWIRAKPIKLELRIPGVDGTEGVTGCDLAAATSDTGCPIRFTHASVIDPSGEFTITTALVYQAESNSGKYDGITFTAKATTTVIVAEAMAVSVGSG